MGLSVNDIIIKAFSITGELGANAAASGAQMKEGLDFLNELIEEMRADWVLIPYLKTVSFTAIAGQDTYVFAPDGDVTSNPIVDIDYINFTDSGNVVRPVKVILATDKYSNYYLTNLQSTLLTALVTQEMNGTIIQFYPSPSQAYGVTVRGKFALNEVSLNDLLIEIPVEYSSFIYLSIGKKLSLIYETANWDQTRESLLKEKKKKLVSSRFNDFWAKDNRFNNLSGAARVLSGV